MVYKFHAFFGCDVTVLRALRRSDLPTVVVRVERGKQDPNSEELRIEVPTWMLSENACAPVVVESSARVDVDALKRPASSR